MRTIAYRYWNEANPLFFVSDIKGKKGDWGYTTDSKKAINLTEAQQKRFSNDCRYCGSNAQFITLTEKE
jgi:hypothetical protein